jgi:hypothetical protein
MRADTVKNIAEVGKGINAAQLTGGNQAVDDGGSFGTSVTPRKHPIPAADGDGPKNPLGQIVIYGKVAIVEVSIQSLPLPTGVTHGLADGTLGKDFDGPVFQPSTDLGEDGLTLLLS